MSDNDKRDRALGELARELSDRIDVLKKEAKPAPVLKLFIGGKREQQLSDAELVAVRRMLAEFDVIARSCPTARNLLDRD
jgi:hypothetical protein